MVPTLDSHGSRRWDTRVQAIHAYLDQPAGEYLVQNLLVVDTPDQLIKSLHRIAQLLGNQFAGKILQSARTLIGVA